MMKAKPIGLYVHIPFCLKKCNYCDFCSFSDLPEGERKRYVSVLKREISSYKRDDKISVDTVFFGGGTPSLLSPQEFLSICDSITDSFDVIEDCEFTIEANPKTLSADKLSAFVSRGVNRISIGLQTIHENERKILGRVHNFSDFEQAYQLVSNVGISNVGVDVMYGIPEQTKDSFAETLRAILSFNPTHVSAYGLILEEDTRFWDMRNTLSLPSEDDECDMYELACELLSVAGFSHYEISNYARLGFESRHNLKYWRGDEYIGVGASAYSRFSGKLYGNTRNIDEYLSENPTQYITEELLDNDTAAYEYTMLALRLKEGFSLSEYKKRFGADFILGKENKIKQYVESGFITCEGDRIALTEKGFYVSNTILTDLL